MSEHLITLGAIRAHSPCEEGWRKLLKTLGTSDPETVLSIGDVAKSNGAPDAFWCLRCIEDPRVRVRAVMPVVKRASAYTTDQRVHDCIATLDQWLAGNDVQHLTAAAWLAARSARSAAWLAWGAAFAVEAWGAAAFASEAARAAAFAAEESGDSREAERARQVEDLIAQFPLHAIKEGRKDG